MLDHFQTLQKIAASTRERWVRKRSYPLSLCVPSQTLPNSSRPVVVVVAESAGFGGLSHVAERDFEEGRLYLRFRQRAQLCWETDGGPATKNADLAHGKLGEFQRLHSKRAKQESMMHRNVARAYDYLQAEHDRIRTACVKVLAQNDRTVERQLLRPSRHSPRHLDEIVLYEERLSGPERKRVLDLNRYGRKIERIMDALLRL
jgi:hypothetical protein